MYIFLFSESYGSSYYSEKNEAKGEGSPSVDAVRFVKYYRIEMYSFKSWSVDARIWFLELILQLSSNTKQKVETLQ